MTAIRLADPEPAPSITSLPGETWLDSGARRSSRVRLRGVAFGPVTARNPPLRSWLLIAHRRGGSPMSRQIGAESERTHVQPGQLTLHPDGVPALWSWSAPIDVLHVHLGLHLLDRAARDVLGAPLAQVRMRHGLGLDDPDLLRLSLRLEEEALQDLPGATLCMEGLAAELAVTLMRRYGEPAFPAEVAPGLDPLQQARVLALVLSRASNAVPVEEMADAAGLGRSGFAQRFRASFGVTPHQFVLETRLRRAAALLEESRLPIAEIAATTGFSDQSHMTRLFRRRHGLTPGAYRRRR